jgi:hypothetical protein
LYALQRSNDQQQIGITARLPEDVERAEQHRARRCAHRCAHRCRCRRRCRCRCGWRCVIACADLDANVGRQQLPDLSYSLTDAPGTYCSLRVRE